MGGVLFCSANCIASVQTRLLRDPGMSDEKAPLIPQDETETLARRLNDIKLHSLSILPLKDTDSTFETAVYCDCRGLIDLKFPGVYRIKSNRGRKSLTLFDTLEVHPDAPITRVRVFPKKTTRVVDLIEDTNTVYLIVTSSDGKSRPYLHSNSDCDLLITCNLERPEVVKFGTHPEFK